MQKRTQLQIHVGPHNSIQNDLSFGAMCGETLDRSQMTLDCDRIGGAPAASIRLGGSGSQDGRIRGSWSRGDRKYFP